VLLGGIWARLGIEHELRLEDLLADSPRNCGNEMCLSFPKRTRSLSVTYSPPNQLDRVVNRLESYV
jgi:hypothetical protein